MSSLNYLKESAIRLDQSHRDGKTIMSSQNMAILLKHIVKAIEESRTVSR